MTWSWARTLRRPELWSLHYGTPSDRETPTLRRLADELFFVDRVRTIRPARDRASLETVRRLEDPLRTQVLRQLAVARLPRKNIRLEYPDRHAWIIEYGPQGSIAHLLESPHRRQRLLVGARDGHPSLPVLRLAEWEAMVDRVVKANVPRRYVPWLLVGGVGDPDPNMVLERLLARGADAAAVVALRDPSTWIREIVVPATWRRDPELGWITDWRDSRRNPSGDHAGAALFALARETGSRTYLREARRMQRNAWKANDELSALQRFFAAIGAA